MVNFLRIRGGRRAAAGPAGRSAEPSGERPSSADPGASRGAGARAIEPADRIGVRLAVLARLAGTDRLAAVARRCDPLASELEELATAPSRPAALALLESIDALRREVARERTVAPPVARAGDGSRAGAGLGAALIERGDFVCHRPGRSLVTGEAEVASRGYFDAEDRPPLACWLGLLGASADPPSVLGDHESLWIIAWVPPHQVARARAGCRACPNGGLALLADLAPEAAAQLFALLAAAVDPGD